MKDIDSIRRDNMRLIEQALGSPTAAAKAVEMSPAQWNNLRDAAKDSKTGKPRGMRTETANRIAKKAGYPDGWLDQDHSGTSETTIADDHSQVLSLPRTKYDKTDVVIRQFETGGAMGNGIVLQEQPGIIKEWRVSDEWLRLNVLHFTAKKNLAIVTGFGPSMKPMFNPGDPLLVDTGVNHIDHEGVYFFRVGDEGFIKIVQRVPEFDGPGFVFRIISKNEDYKPYDISPKNPHFEVLGKVLTVWRSEQH